MAGSDEPSLAAFFAERLARRSGDVVLRPPVATAKAHAPVPTIYGSAALTASGTLTATGTATAGDVILGRPPTTTIELDLDAVGWLDFALRLVSVYILAAPIAGPVVALALAAAIGMRCIRSAE